MLTIELPWPNSVLSPNSRAHFHKRALAAREARALARNTIYSVEAYGGIEEMAIEGDIQLSITFCFPDKRARDSDNLNGMCKPYRDGIADALNISDSRFWPTQQIRGEPVRHGRVIVQIG